MTIGEPIRYVVVCACTGHIEALAYLDDDRPAGGALTVTAPQGAAQIVIGYQSREGSPPPGHGTVARTWANSTLSKTVWADTGDYADTGRSQWTIRCNGCSEQAEMRAETLAVIADELAAELEQWPAVMCPDPPEPARQTWDAGQDWATPSDENVPSTGWRPRHPIPFGVLSRRLSRFNV
jgi:hypothetical protein